MPSTTVSPPATLDGDLDPSRYAHLTPAPRPDTAPTVAALTRRARQLADGLAEWRHLVHFDPDQRWRHRFAVGDGYEIWLMSWLPGQRTGQHDHGESVAVIAMASGELQEHRADPQAPDGPPLVHTLRPDQARIWAARATREIVNAAAVPAISVHVYAPALAG